MSRTTSLLLTALMVLLFSSLAGCGGGCEDDDGDATLQPFPAASAPVMTIQPVRCYGAAAAAAECQQ